MNHITKQLSPKSEVTSSDFVSGLEGIVAAQTQLSHVEGTAGRLTIRGFQIEQIAGRATFEEMMYLLWTDRLPDQHELATFRDELANYQALPAATLDLLKSVASAKRPVMDALRIGAGSLDLDRESDSLDQQARLIVARLPLIVAAYWRYLHGESPIEPQPGLGFAANYLYTLTGDTPSAPQIRALDTYLNTVCDHGLNASTFTARVIIATQTDLLSAVVGAIGALKGPLHGGAPGPALEMVFEIGKPELAEPVMRGKLARGERLMGFGHRIYKVRDPRAELLSRASELLFASQNAKSADNDFYRLVQHVEQVAIALLKEHKPGRNLQTNVEFYTALLLHSLGFESELFSPTFAISRAAGWIAHCMEQLGTGRLIRPKAAYIGQVNRKWVDLAQRDNQ